MSELLGQEGVMLLNICAQIVFFQAYCWKGWDGWTDGWKDEWMDGRTDGWMDG